ncbi:conserved hypothetical protein [Ricinus communis]|uniref:Reverse transcriptase domain-containing protein n=1 Tax=Ricinus communis TaxID=3988 RepID=B9SQV2_RICCO|nr:conserved hypothetical protein [Ricinus communis]
MCAKVLSALVAREERRGLLSRCRICRGAPGIPHLPFVDDNFFFFKANEVECRTIQRIFSLYEEASGQAINFQKSGIFFSSHVSDGNVSDLGSNLRVTSPLNTGRYLGLSSLISRGNNLQLIHRLCMVAWGIWNNRNSKIWWNTRQPPTIMINKCMDFLQSWTQAQQKKHYLISKAHVPGIVSKWISPSQGSFKCNVDAASFSSSNITRLGKQTVLFIVLLELHFPSPNIWHQAPMFVESFLHLNVSPSV